ncbi:pseudouridine synthase [Bdellovibrio sp. HCB337]|uniref:pseudouridine synthase n=1 Tax=Bdellovibrio sp. HCB337 TaxID=3394358 RepID=UPI0039A61BDE
MSAGDDNKVRLSKLMAEKGLCSRREADVYIAAGLVFVDGEVVSVLGTKVSPNARVTLDSQALKNQKSLATILLNKPIGYVSAQPEPQYTPAIKLITPENQFGTSKTKLKQEHFEGLAVAGRLDIDSQGLLIFTQDGRIAKQIIGENSDIEKEYLVRVEGVLPKEKLQLLRHGLVLDGKPLLPAVVEWINEDQLRFILKEGKKRQIRRMCEAVGLRVRGLKRVRVGKINLGHLPEGKWRFLEPGESLD